MMYKPYETTFRNQTLTIREKLANLSFTYLLLIITLADILADDIKMNGINAVLSVEGYAAGIQDNVTKFQEIYDRASIIR